MLQFSIRSKFSTKNVRHIERPLPWCNPSLNPKHFVPLDPGDAERGLQAELRQMPAPTCGDAGFANLQNKHICYHTTKYRDRVYEGQNELSEFAHFSIPYPKDIGVRREVLNRLLHRLRG